VRGARVCHETVPDVGQSLPVVTIRHAQPGDHARVSPQLDEWWGGRPMRAMLPRLFFEHFRDTSFVAEESGELVGFLCGFLSQTYPDQAYVHFIGVRPEQRGGGLGSELYERFFAAVRAAGREVVRCITSPRNESSIAFHRRLGFEIEAEVDDYDGAGEARVLLRKRLL
jgi:ribosomal protein S18 acetylase RimI-like enzyme